MELSPQGTMSGDASPPSQKRQRAKQACEPCRLRKRRCDGDLPCNMCTKFEYKCYFEKQSRKRSKIVEKDAVENGILSPTHNHDDPTAKQKTTLPKDDMSSPEEISKLRLMEANSGMAFTRLLGTRLDASAGSKLFTFGWNLGTVTRTLPPVRPITDLISAEQLLAMATLYFENVHPLYGFVDKDWILKQIPLRYMSVEANKNCPDHLLGGIAAIGSLFAPDPVNGIIQAIIDAAKLSMESSSIMQTPNLCDVQAWMLRSLYLRFSGHPHPCWLSSSITMHLVESVGLHQESTNSVIYSSEGDNNYDPDTRQRVFWVARMLNSWVSNEYGRSRVALRGITCKLPERRHGDLTRDYIDLYSISCCLDPDLLDKPGRLEDFLSQLESFPSSHESMDLSKANLGMCAYRRLRLANPNLPTDILNRIISIVLKGLQAAKSLATKRMPWWHVANVPFQTICVFLAMDSRESLSNLATAMRTLEYVVDRFKTPTMKEALKTARFLVRLSKRKKEEDSDVLAQSLQKDADGDPQPESLLPTVPPLITDQPYMAFEEAPTTTSSGEDWNLDYLNNSEFDWNFFLSQDIPAFHHLAPDGMM